MTSMPGKGTTKHENACTAPGPGRRGDRGSPEARALYSEKKDIFIQKWGVVCSQTGQAVLNHTALRSNQCVVRRQILTSISMTGTSMSTPTTVARAAPDERPNSMVEVAMATSK